MIVSVRVAPTTLAWEIISSASHATHARYDYAGALGTFHFATVGDARKVCSRLRRRASDDPKLARRAALAADRIEAAIDSTRTRVLLVPPSLRKSSRRGGRATEVRHARSVRIGRFKKPTAHAASCPCAACARQDSQRRRFRKLHDEVVGNPPITLRDLKVGSKISTPRLELITLWRVEKISRLPNDDRLFTLKPVNFTGSNEELAAVIRRGGVRGYLSGGAPDTLSSRIGRMIVRDARLPAPLGPVGGPAPAAEARPAPRARGLADFRQDVRDQWHRLRSAVDRLGNRLAKPHFTESEPRRRRGKKKARGSRS